MININLLHYKIVSDKYASKMKELVENMEDINVQQIRIHIDHFGSFGITWESPGTQKKKKKRDIQS